MKLNYKKTFLLGFGFLASSIAWAIYNANVPLMLEGTFGLSTLVIGAIMTIDNVFGVIFQPLFGALSDKTRSHYGRRMPYIMLGIPVCAVLFAIIPHMRTVVGMMLVVILFNLVMSMWRAPVVALMPDVTAPALRSKGNAVINLMGGVGTIIAFLGGGALINLGDSLFPHGGYPLAFALGAIVMVAALIILVKCIREPEEAYLPNGQKGKGLLKRIKELFKPDKKEKKESFFQGVKTLSQGERKSLILLLFAIFFWFCGFNAIEAFFTLFATNVLGLSSGTASMLLSAFALMLVVFAIPAGILGTKLGRKKTIVIGLAGMVVLLSPMAFIQDVTVTAILLILGGICWGFVNINSLPMVVELASTARVGAFTGYYYFFSFSAAIASPILFGLIRDLTGQYNLLFVYSGIMLLCAFLCMLFVKHGEAEKLQ